jgi:hypothetical protein
MTVGDTLNGGPKCEKIHRAFTTWLKQQQIPVTVIESEGRHTWMV